MSNIKGEMILIGCGGAGTSIVGNLAGHLANLGNGFADVRTEYVDTSDANIKLLGVTEDNFFFFDFCLLNYSSFSLSNNWNTFTGNLPF